MASRGPLLELWGFIGAPLTARGLISLRTPSPVSSSGEQHGLSFVTVTCTLQEARDGKGSTRGPWWVLAVGAGPAGIDQMLARDRDGRGPPVINDCARFPSLPKARRRTAGRAEKNA
ncbi:hypothetical protein BCR34DRAFT_603699 [Clohesyomyces aquaticus]|uniref:Uncharacterized protein n=1 Tax=Clohesyomyces aquaticus TaxID=1231657 RepID=A0A1Y1ZCZ6_9PLEO|nr:hypothetical protein BCR34DRAFT_603699 [Clohesyomyces aquaticus]